MSVRDVTPYELEFVRHFRMLEPIQRELVYDTVVSLGQELNAKRATGKPPALRLVQSGASA